MTILSGTAPVAAMRDYQTEVAAYTKGHGRLSCALKGYEPCHNAEEVIAQKAYDSEKDTENPTGSVFCSHGAGFVVSYDKVREYMHLDSGLHLEKKKNRFVKYPPSPPVPLIRAADWQMKRNWKKYLTAHMELLKRKEINSTENVP